jgi:hypothetical protein
VDIIFKNNLDKQKLAGGFECNIHDARYFCSFKKNNSTVFWRQKKGERNYRQKIKFICNHTTSFSSYKSKVSTIK